MNFSSSFDETYRFELQVAELVEEEAGALEVRIWSSRCCRADGKNL